MDTFSQAFAATFKTEGLSHPNFLACLRAVANVWCMDIIDIVRSSACVSSATFAIYTADARHDCGCSAGESTEGRMGPTPLEAE